MHTMNFGRYKNRALSEVPFPYLDSIARALAVEVRLLKAEIARRTSQPVPESEEHLIAV